MLAAVANPAGEDDEDEVMDEGYNDTFNPYKPAGARQKKIQFRYVSKSACSIVD